MKSKLRFLLICVSGCLVMALLAGILALPGTALAKKPTDKGGGGGKQERIPLCATFDDFLDPDPSGALDDRIQSDGLGDYRDSDPEVSAWSFGGFAMDTRTPEKREFQLG